MIEYLGMYTMLVALGVAVIYLILSLAINKLFILIHKFHTRKCLTVYIAEMPSKIVFERLAYLNTSFMLLVLILSNVLVSIFWVYLCQNV